MSSESLSSGPNNSGPTGSDQVNSGPTGASSLKHWALEKWDSSTRFRQFWYLIWPGLIALVPAGLLFGASLTDGTLAWAIALALAVIVILIRAGVRAVVAPWPRLRNLRREGTNTEVAMLAWQTIDREGLLTERGQREIASTARARLERLGVRWVGSLPVGEAAQLLGPELVELVTTEQPSSFDIRRVSACLRHLESLLNSSPEAAHAGLVIDAQEPEND